MGGPLLHQAACRHGRRSRKDGIIEGVRLPPGSCGAGPGSGVVSRCRAGRRAVEPQRVVQLPAYEQVRRHFGIDPRRRPEGIRATGLRQRRVDREFPAGQLGAAGLHLRRPAQIPGRLDICVHARLWKHRALERLRGLRNRPGAVVGHGPYDRLRRGRADEVGHKPWRPHHRIPRRRSGAGRPSPTAPHRPWNVY